MNIPAVDLDRARRLISTFRDLPMLVVGDVILDRFIVGKVVRISPEAPVPVVHFRSEYSRLGGAANVARNLAVLGADVTLIGIVGEDRAADLLREELRQAGIRDATLVVDRSRPTVEKVRVVTDRNQQVARIDYEDDHEVTGVIADAIASTIAARGHSARALVASDYMKGVLTAQAMSALVALKRPGVPLVVDPKIPHLSTYAGATVITPNHHEAETATHRLIRSDDEARVAAIDFRERAKCESAVITRGEHGMWLSSPDVEGAIPSFAREVSDVTGAGDTVVATLALALAAGATLSEGAVLANHSAGVVVGRFGPAAVTPQELLAAIENSRG
jgi:D-glycero-beta-D-manno-heptose-7-phosphate kinase